MSHSRIWILCAIGLTVLLAWWMGRSTNDWVADAASRTETAPSKAWWADSTSLPASIQRQSSVVPVLTQPAPSIAAQPAHARVALVPITVTSPQNLLVGEQTDLVVGVGANVDVGEVSFTVQFDPDVLQVRAGTEGDWTATSARPEASFAAEISEAADHVRIRSTVAARRAVATGGSVAVVQFQAVAPGTSSVVIADVTVKDLAGNPMPVLLSSPRFQVTAERVPPAPTEALQSHGLAPADAPATEPVDSD